MAAFRRMSDNAQSSAAKQRATLLLHTSLAEISVAVQNRNSMILDANATVVARQMTMAADADDAVMADVQMGDVVDAGVGA